MNNDRHKEWLSNTGGISQIDMILLNDALGLGDLDSELVREFPELKINSNLEEDQIRVFRHITISRLWVLGAYELIRTINEITSRKKNEINPEVIRKIKDNLRLFGKIRVPLVKLEKEGQHGQLFSGVASKRELDEFKGLGWRIVSKGKKNLEVETFYRKDLGDSLLDLFKTLNKNIRTK